MPQVRYNLIYTVNVEKQKGECLKKILSTKRFINKKNGLNWFTMMP